MWDGVRLLPAGWVDYGRTMVSIDDPEDASPYGAHWWGVAGDSSSTSLGTFRASGYEGQSISICPPSTSSWCGWARRRSSARTTSSLGAPPWSRPSPRAADRPSRAQAPIGVATKTGIWRSVFSWYSA